MGEAYNEGKVRSPKEIINDKLNDESKSSVPCKTAFFLNLALAWETLAYDESAAKDEWGLGLSTRQSIIRHHLIDYYQEFLRGREQSPSIRLALPQVKIMDALTEAAGIPHERGKKEFQIPESIRAHMDKMWERRAQRVGG
jgi:hypothetical protein